MPTTERISVEVPSDVAGAMRAQIAAGQYATESDAVTEALRYAHDQDPATENWLRNVVVPICASIEAGTATLLTLEDARKRVRASR